MAPAHPTPAERQLAAHRAGIHRRPSPAGGRPADDDRLTAAIAGDVDVDLTSALARHLDLRTAWFDHILFAALDGGMTQVLLAGAGYDGRALRYHRDGVRWWELDDPAVLADKVSHLDRLGISADHLAFVATALTSDLEFHALADQLQAAGVDEGQPSIFLLEAVAPSLDLPTLIALLRGLRSVAGPHSLLALGLATDSDDPEAAARRAAFARSVEALGQPARAVLTVAEADPLFATTGWRLIPEASLPPSGFALLEPN